MQQPKVKLGDRITALQQIVSPFGKVEIDFCFIQFSVNFFNFIFRLLSTIIDNNYNSYFQTDTASVLTETIGYIKFLQEQIQVRIIIYCQIISVLLQHFKSKRKKKDIYIF